ncbi:MAG: efflux RND transporter permease subunit [Desulfatibacillaceae bacterium]|nr:efflux RND transporter permease subunit [Desulfatibacillaceae bacterium]
MIINQMALRRQITVMALLVIIVVAGIYSYVSLPRESFPDITIPFVFVTTDYEGVAPEDIEKLITIPIERQLRGLADTEEVRSTSAEGISHVAVQFLPSVNIDDALQKVRDKVEQAKNDLPPDLPEDPKVIELNFQDIPVIRVVLSGPFSLRRLQSFAEDLEDKIVAVPGVLDAQISGGLEREIHVEFDLDRVAAYNVPFSSIIESVTRGNVNMPAGSMDIGDAKFLVRVPEEFADPSEIFSIVAFMREGKPVYLRDIANISDSFREPLTLSRINGERSVTLSVQKRTGENIIAVTDGVKKVVEEMRHQFPAALNIALTADQSDDVRLMVADLENNILSGLVLVLVVIFIFIGGRSAFLVALAIPYSMFLTFMLLTAFDVSLNMVVLFSLILALGMLVDNGIVIVENIYRHMQDGQSSTEAASIGTDEVAWPVITSTLTTCGAFFPMLFWPGIMGEFMGFLPQTLIMALASSLFVALVINPVLSARFQRIPKKALKARDGKPPKIHRAYIWLLHHALNHRLLTVFVAIAMLFGAIFVYSISDNGVEFFPEADPRRAYVRIQAPEGTNLEASDRFVRQVEEVVTQYPDIRFVISEIGTLGGNPFSGQGGSGTHLSTVVLDFEDFKDRSRPSPEVLDEIRDKLLALITGAQVRVEKEEGGPPTGAPVNIEISGEDLSILGALAAQVKKELEKVPQLVDVKDDFVRGKPEVRVNIDKEKAAFLGLDAYTIAYTVKAAINGVKVGVFRHGKDEYDIIARLPEADRQSVENLKRITVSGPGGEPVPLTSVAQVSLGSGIGAIQRLDQKRIVTVSADLAEGGNANAIIAVLKKELAQHAWPKGYDFTFTGEQQEQAKATAFLSKAFLAAIGIILLVLLTQFNSVSAPLIVMASVLLSLIGVFLGLVITGKPFGVIMTGIGVISLAGVVVNNAIVLIDYYFKQKDLGMPARNALMVAGLVRLRPVLLTAVTTILGLLPMATGISFDFRKFAWDIGSESSQWWGSMAVAVIFGLGVATLLTLVVVPALCLMADNASQKYAAIVNADTNAWKQRIKAFLGKPQWMGKAPGQKGPQKNS